MDRGLLIAYFGSTLCKCAFDSKRNEVEHFESWEREREFVSVMEEGKIIDRKSFIFRRGSNKRKESRKGKGKERKISYASILLGKVQGSIVRLRIVWSFERFGSRRPVSAHPRGNIVHACIGACVRRVMAVMQSAPLYSYRRSHANEQRQNRK